VGSFARAIAPDLPGYGDADKPRDFDYTVAGYARHLAGVLDQLGVQRAHLVLHDFGGVWGLAWAAQHPDALATATLLGTGVFIDYRWHHWARIWRTPILGELFMATATRWGFGLLIGRENPRLSRDDVDRLFASLRSFQLLKISATSTSNGDSRVTSSRRSLGRLHPSVSAVNTAPLGQQPN
jgi:pimeloyl-ACP methyl ester carboxylesterase